MSHRNDVETLIKTGDAEFVSKLFDYVDMSDGQKAIRSYVRVRCRYGMVSRMLEVLASNEVDMTNKEGELFRRNSLASRFVAAYTEITCLDFLKRVLKDPLTMLCKEADENSFEIDPARLPIQAPGNAKKTSASPSVSIAVNQARLKAASQRILDAILTSVDQSPAAMKRTCAQLRMVVTKKFPRLSLTIVGGLLFLRFWIPAVTTPEGYNVVPFKISESARRALILVAKILQSLTNGVELGQKEAYLAPLNSFVVENSQVMTAYLDKISCATHATLPEMPFDEITLNADLDDFFACLHRSKQRLEAAPIDKMSPALGNQLSKVIVAIHTHSPPQGVSQFGESLDLDLGVFGFFPSLRFVGVDRAISPKRSMSGALSALVTVALSKTEHYSTTTPPGTPRRPPISTEDMTTSTNAAAVKSQHDHNECCLPPPPPGEEPMTPPTSPPGTPPAVSPSLFAVNKQARELTKEKCPVKGSGKLLVKRKSGEEKDHFVVLDNANLNFFRFKDLTMIEGKPGVAPDKIPQFSVDLFSHDALVHEQRNTIDIVADTNRNNTVLSLVCESAAEKNTWSKALAAAKKWATKHSRIKKEENGCNGDDGNSEAAKDERIKFLTEENQMLRRIITEQANGTNILREMDELKQELARKTVLLQKAKQLMIKYNIPE